jgi:hypothetical protein
MKKYISVLLILLFCNTAYSQTENNLENKNGTTNSITKFDEQFAIRAELESATIEYELQYLDDADSNTNMIYYYNQGEDLSLNLSASYLEYTASFSIDTGDISNITDVKLSKYSRKYWIDLNYQNYKGFYIDNPSDFGLPKNDPSVEHSDLKITNYNANYIYIFSDDFSIAAAMEQTERQNSWDWTFLLGVSSGLFEIKSDESMLPPSEESSYENYSGYKGGEYYYIAAMPGLGITIPVWNFFFTYTILFGGGYAYEISQTADGEISRNTNLMKVITKGSIGYNGDNCFALFTLTFDNTEVNGFSYNNAAPNVGIVKSSIAAGVRF